MYFAYGEQALSYLRKKDKRLCEVIDRIGHIDRTVDPDLFSSVVHHIIGQQISTKAQATIWQRMQDALGTVNAEAILAAGVPSLQALGVTFRKAAYITDFAERVHTGAFDLDAVAHMSDEAAIRALRSLKGIGVWTAEMILRFCQRRKVKDFFIKFKKKSHFADFLTEQTLDFVLHRLFCGLAEMDTDDIGCLADLLSDSRASGGVGCGIVHSKSSCK